MGFQLIKSIHKELVMKTIIQEDQVQMNHQVYLKEIINLITLIELSIL